ncbi:TspO/MBR family protein [Microcella putealis]|uniref:TspO/MBR family protein n=1 Tax=Microcella putealis TaxID=337005 RepID=UPI00102B38CB|nr:TspO/MBR family protein [Microcella putealis]
MSTIVAPPVPETRARAGAPRPGEWLVLGVLLAVNAGIAAFGSAVSREHIDGWYASVPAPIWVPENWVFGAVWSTLYVLISVAAWLVWRERRRRRVSTALTAYVVQMVLNSLWSPVFFALYPAIGSLATWLALGIHMLLLLSLVVMMSEFWQVRRTASILVAPYALWVIYAASLTVAYAVVLP